jgi:hypothetical protein
MSVECKKTKPASRRQRHYRQRRAVGVTVLRVMVPRYDFVESLIESGRLTVAEALDRRLVERAAGEILESVTKRWKQPK